MIQPEKEAIRVSVDKKGNPWAVDSQGSIWTYQGGWKQIQGDQYGRALKGIDIAAGKNSDVFVAAEMTIDLPEGRHQNLYGVWKLDDDTWLFDSRAGNEDPLLSVSTGWKENRLLLAN